MTTKQKNEMITLGDGVQVTADELSLIPVAQESQVRKFDALLTAWKTQIAECENPITRGLMQTRAMTRVRKLVAEMILEEAKAMMGHPDGFLTDRDGRESGYDEKTICDVVATALLQGAKLHGNEFNIISGRAYFTKEFYSRALQEAGVKNLSILVGSVEPIEARKLAKVELTATWTFRGESRQMDFHKSHGVDHRIDVRWHGSSGIDQLKGLAESKALRRIYKQLGFFDPGQGDQAEIALPELTPQQKFTESIESQVSKSNDIKEIRAIWKEADNDVRESDWSDETKALVMECITVACEDRKKELDK